MLRHKSEKRGKKLDIFTVTRDWYNKDGDFEILDGYQAMAMFIQEEKAIDWAREYVPNCEEDRLGTSTVYVGGWIYADSIEINPSDGEPYDWDDVDIYGDDLGTDIFTVTSADKQTAESWGLVADEYGNQRVAESRRRRRTRISSESRRFQS